MDTDPGETRNLAGERPDLVRSLEAELDDWIRDQVARHNLPGDPLVLQAITLGRDYSRRLREHDYW